MTVQNIPGQAFYFCSFVAVITNCLCIKSLWETIELHDKNALLNQFQGSLSPRCQLCKSLLRELSRRESLIRSVGANPGLWILFWLFS